MDRIRHSRLQNAFDFGDKRAHELYFAEDVNTGGSKEFFSFKTPGLFEAYYKNRLTAEEPPHMYEVIRAGTSCLMYFDADGIVDSVSAAVSQIQEILAAIRAELGALGVGGALSLSRSLRRVQSGFKNSFHVTCHELAVGQCADAAAFYGLVFERLLLNGSEQSAQALDAAVYTRNRCMRLIGSTKLGSD
jgi:hypothetical protein